MTIRILKNNDQYILNHCTKFLERVNIDHRHNFGQFSELDPRSRICESWRFPIIDTYSDGEDFAKSYTTNLVTFVYLHPYPCSQNKVSIIGTFANLYKPIELKSVKFMGEETRYSALQIVVPKMEYHTYKFIVGDRIILDPINPQKVTLDNDQVWSRFFTHLCTEVFCFERWEFAILDRLVKHILPFRTEEGEKFLKRYYKKLERESSKEVQDAYAYRLNHSVGVVTFIDNILAREESHNLKDYKICLKIIDHILRKRAPNIEPHHASKKIYIALYNEMADTNNKVKDWDYKQYDKPEKFLELLRRHTYTGAFSHPKYGGNVGAAGWAYLSERYRDQSGETLFDWRRAIEKPLGLNSDYRG